MTLAVACAGSAYAQTSPAAANQAMLQKYCAGCHNDKLKTAGVSVQGLDLTSVSGKA